VATARASLPETRKLLRAAAVPVVLRRSVQTLTPHGVL